MAKKQKVDYSLNNRLEELERLIFVLKIQYEKYFSGIERIEPLKDREELKRIVRDLMITPITNTAQKHKFRMLKARFSSLDLYIQRNLYQIEKGTHPKMKFRASMSEKRQREMEIKREQRQEKQRVKREFSEKQKEELAYRAVYDRLMDARRQTGQSTDISFDTIRDTLKKQSRQIKGKFGVEKVKFRVAVEDGKAKMKAVPVRNDKDS